jgi:hypothetical protein
MTVNMVATAHTAQFESERLYEATKFGKSDVAKVTRLQSLPEVPSTGTRHARIAAALARNPSERGSSEVVREGHSTAKRC